MFKETDRKWLAWAIIVALILVSTITGVSFPIPPIPETAGLGAQGVEQGRTDLTGLRVAAPTTIPTGTAAVVVDSLGVSTIFEIRDAATPVMAVEDGGELNVDGTIDANSTVNIEGALTLQEAFYSSFTNLTVTNGYTLTPIYTTYALDTSGAVTITLNATGQEGQLLVIINDDANATIIADTNLRSSDGNAITLAGALDVVVFVYQDSEWLELLLIANS